MAKKKKLKKRKPNKPIILSREEEQLISSTLDNLKELDPDNFKREITDPRIALALLEKLPLKDRSEVSVLSLVRESFEDKAVQKAAKKISFKLKQKGFEIPWDSLQDEGPVIKLKLEKENPEAYLGPFSMSGDRAVLMMIPQAPKGIDIGLGVVNYFDGISYFLYDRYSKKHARDVKKFFFEQTIEVIETSVEHAADVLEKAYKSGTVKSGDKIAGYLKLRPWIQENILPPDKPVIYEVIDRKEVAEESLTKEKLSFLFEDECMATWILDPDQMQPVVEDIIQVDSSPIVLSEEQKNIRIDEIKEKSLANLLPDTKVKALKDMLEEMAYFFHSQEKGEIAETALLSALELEKCEDIKTSLFLEYLMDRSLSFFMGPGGEKSDKGTEPESTPTIITP